MKKRPDPATAHTQSRKRGALTTSRSSALVRGRSTQFIANPCRWPQRPCPETRLHFCHFHAVFCRILRAFRKEAHNLRMLMQQHGFRTMKPTIIFCDNKGAITMGLHPSNKSSTRHINMIKHFCRQHVELGNVTTPFKKLPTC